MLFKEDASCANISHDQIKFCYHCKLFYVKWVLTLLGISFDFTISLVIIQE